MIMIIFKLIILKVMLSICDIFTFLIFFLWGVFSLIILYFKIIRFYTGFDSWVGKIPWRRKWQPPPVILPGKSHGWRSLAGTVTKSWTWLSDFTFTFRFYTVSTIAVPNLFGTREWFCGRWFFHGPEGCKRWGVAVNTDEASLTHLPLTSCCEAWFLRPQTGTSPWRSLF